jgi:hypothetical protein
VNILANIERRRKRIEERLDRRWQPERLEPVMEEANIRYEVSDRVSATDAGGLGMMRSVVRCLGLAELIDEKVELLKKHRPYHESDHILSLVYSMICGEKTLDGLSSRREDEAFLDALSARRIPHPTTAGDFLRRFDRPAVGHLMAVTNECSARVWRQRGAAARKLAIIDVDGTIAETTGECREQMSMAYEGSWGYHPLVVSLANSQEFLAVVNRPGNHSSNTNAAAWMDYGIRWALEDAGFESVLLRGDTAFALTKNFDRWTKSGVKFAFGIMGHARFMADAEALPEEAWSPFNRGNPAEPSRKHQTNVRKRVVEEKGFEELVLEAEHVAEWEYTPKRMAGSYRMIALRKTIKVLKGQARLEDEVRYFFYVTNLDPATTDTAGIVRLCNARCNQENLIEQLKNGVGATRLPSVSFHGNWAHMVIGALAWNLKAWLGLLMSTTEPQLADAILRMEFRTFVNGIIRTPVQILHQARRLVFRLLSVNRWTHILIHAPPRLRQLRLA